MSVIDTIVVGQDEYSIGGTGGTGGGYAPIGTIISFMGTTAPQDFLACDGTVYNISAYPELANFFGTQFGSVNFFGGNGTTTFAVPDLRGEFLRGTGTNSHANQGNGDSVGVHQDGTEIPRISWNGNETVLYMNNTPTGSLEVKNVDKGITNTPTTSKGRRFLMSSEWNDSNNNAYSTRPTNTSVLYCIKAQTTFENAASYSTDEKKIATWIDGKPLYQKTIQTTVPIHTTTNYTSVGTGISIDKCIDCNFMFGTVTFQHGKGIATRMSTASEIFSVRVINNNASSNANSVSIFNNWEGADNATIYVTIKYTKTTD